MATAATALVASLETPATHAPVAFDGSTVYDFGPDVGLYPGFVGTIELWFAVPGATPPPSPPRPAPAAPPAPASTADLIPVLAYSDGAGNIGYRVTVDANLSSIGIDFGGARASAHCNFADGQFHHAAFLIRESQTAIVIDGVLQPQPSNGGFGDALANGGILTIGGDGSRVASAGLLLTFRLWNRALSIADLSVTKAFYGLPQSVSLLPSLLAYSNFTNEIIEVRYTRPAVTYSSLAGPLGGDPFIVPILGRQISKIYVKLTDADGLNDFRVEIQTAGVPEFLPSRAGRPGLTVTTDRTVAQAEMDQIAQLQSQPPSPGSPSTITQLQQNLASLLTQDRAAELGFDNDTAAGQAGYQIFAFNPAERLTAIGITHDGNTIRSIRFRTDSRLSPVFQTPTNLTQGFFRGRPFVISAPDGADCAAIIGRRNGNQVLSLGLGFSNPVLSDQDQLMRDLTGRRWLERQASEPFLGTSGDAGRTYVRPPVYCFQWNPAANSLTMFRDVEGNVAFQTIPFRRTSGLQFVRTDKQDLSTLIAFEDGFDIEGAEFLNQPTRFVSRNPPDLGGQDKLEWAGTFTLDQHPTQIKANFLGYNTYLMNPRNLALTGVDKFLFKYPDDDATDYTVTDNQIIVPRGFLFRPENLGNEFESTKTVQNSSQHAETWAVSLGGEVGIPGIASFSLNGSYENEQQTICKNGNSRTIARTIETRYALVVDLAAVELSDEFTARVLGLRDALLAQGTLVAVDDFLREFGSHYPYAVTYGGTAILEKEYTSSEVMQLTSKSISLDEHASGLFDIISVGGSVGLKNRTLDAFGVEVSTSVEVFTTYGGSISRGAGWTLPKGEEVPVFLDLRPIYELLSPLFFEDSMIFNDLRAIVKKAFDQLSAQALSSATARGLSVS